MWIGCSESSGSAIASPAAMHSSNVASLTGRLWIRFRGGTFELTWHDDGMDPFRGARRQFEETGVEVTGHSDRMRATGRGVDDNRLVRLGELAIGIHVQIRTRDFD